MLYYFNIQFALSIRYIKKYKWFKNNYLKKYL